MNVLQTFKYDLGFNLQSDVDLLNNIVDWVDGPDRAYLVYPTPDGYEETVAFWILDDVNSSETLAAVLAIPEPVLSKVKPWFIRWIKDGKLIQRQVPVGIDRGTHLLITLADADVLDRRSHLFGYD